MQAMELRPIRHEERFEVAELIYSSINTWYRSHGRPRGFVGGPHVR